ncbi:hypothetical protein [Coleofasciculus chthonoplastes]|uniref:hypothetical protein n=1 Tax=Coleofasciculus chthonoplastes TaxID=64178 RepID=UPI0032FB5032
MTNDQFFVPEVPQEDYPGIRGLVKLLMKIRQCSIKPYQREDSLIQSRQHQSTPCHQLANAGEPWCLHRVTSRIEEDVI